MVVSKKYAAAFFCKKKKKIKFYMYCQTIDFFCGNEILLLTRFCKVLDENFASARRLKISSYASPQYFVQ